MIPIVEVSDQRGRPREIIGTARSAFGRASMNAAFTFVEVVITLALLGLLTTLVAPAARSVIVERTEDRAILDLRIIDSEIQRYLSANGYLPESLADLNISNLLDPWGNPYVYLSRNDRGWRGKARKDRFLVPLNQDYDLYSSGPDGESRTPLANPKSHDDIIRAADGSYFGRADEF